MFRIKYAHCCQEITMRPVISAIALLCAATFSGSAAAQASRVQSTTSRTVVAAAKLAVSDAPMHFESLSVTLAPGQTSRVAAENGILYQVSGSTAVTLDAGIKVLSGGEGLFLPSGRAVSLKAAPGEPDVLLHFRLVSALSAGQPVETAPAVVKELYRTTTPIPDLKSGGYDVNLSRITFPPRMPSNPPHHRTGAALYYVLAGTGANTVAGTTEAKGPGSFAYEPSGLVHQWGNAGDEPFTFLVFNINPEGMAAVVPAVPVKSP